MPARRIELEEAAQYLERIRERTAASRLRDKFDPGRHDRLERALRSQGGDEMTELLRSFREDHAGRYLAQIAQSSASPTRLVASLEHSAKELAQTGALEDDFEWRIGTAGSDRLEQLSGTRFRVWARWNGVFSAEFATFVEAYEARWVLRQLQMDLFYAIGWATRAPHRSTAERAEEYPYLVQISEEARADPAPFDRCIEEWRTTIDRDGLSLEQHVRRRQFEWSDGPSDGYELAVSSRSLEVSDAAQEPERAWEFLGVYARLIGDLHRVLGWRWL